MNDNDFIYAVARVRVNEQNLLPEADLRRLIGAESYEDAVSALNSRGYSIEGTDFNSALSKKQSEALELLFEILPDKSVLNALFITNDYHNLKCAIKSSVTGIDSQRFLISPSVYDAASIYAAAIEHKWDDLPEELQDTAVKAYGILAKTNSAQRSDSVIDSACISAMLAYAVRSGSDLLKEYTNELAAATNVRILYRCASQDKTGEAAASMCVPSDGLDLAPLIESIENGRQAFIDALSKTPYSYYAEALSSGDAAFEKLCDDRLLEICERGKQTSFGPDPVIAYYVAVRAEILTLRIILSCKLNGISGDIISQRVRKLYV